MKISVKIWKIGKIRKISEKIGKIRRIGKIGKNRKISVKIGKIRKIG